MSLKVISSNKIPPSLHVYLYHLMVHSTIYGCTDNLLSRITKLVIGIQKNNDALFQDIRCFYAKLHDLNHTDNDLITLTIANAICDELIHYLQSVFYSPAEDSSIAESEETEGVGVTADTIIAKMTIPWDSLLDDAPIAATNVTELPIAAPPIAAQPVTATPSTQIISRTVISPQSAFKKPIIYAKPKSIKAIVREARECFVRKYFKSSSSKYLMINFNYAKLCNAIADSCTGNPKYGHLQDISDDDVKVLSFLTSSKEENRYFCLHFIIQRVTPTEQDTYDTIIATFVQTVYKGNWYQLTTEELYDCMDNLSCDVETITTYKLCIQANMQPYVTFGDITNITLSGIYSAQDRKLVFSMGLENEILNGYVMPDAN